MIEVHIVEDDIKNALKTQELFTYLSSKNHHISPIKKEVPGAKVELLTGIAITTLGFTAFQALYPVIKDLQNWVRPRRYTLSMTDGNIVGTANDLTEEEYLQLVKQLNQKKIKIEITDSNE